MRTLKDKESQQLGMPIGTAQGRLAQQILFMVVQKAGLDVCYRCSKTIERAEDLSTEHKEPWLDVSPALFWDLCNIAFSHRACNYRANRRNKRTRAPEGTAWCSIHQQYLPTSEFYKNATMPGGYNQDCKACQGEHRKKDYAATGK